MIASNRLYLILVLALIPYALSGLWQPLEYIGTGMNLLLLIALVIDYRKTPSSKFLEAERHVQDRLSIGR